MIQKKLEATSAFVAIQEALERIEVRCLHIHCRITENPIAWPESPGMFRNSFFPCLEKHNKALAEKLRLNPKQTTPSQPNLIDYKSNYYCINAPHSAPNNDGVFFFSIKLFHPLSNEELIDIFNAVETMADQGVILTNQPGHPKNKHRIPFEIIKITQLSPTSAPVLCHPSLHMPTPASLSDWLGSIQSLPTSILNDAVMILFIDFLSPADLTLHGKKLAETPPLTVILQSILRRLKQICVGNISEHLEESVKQYRYPEFISTIHEDSAVAKHTFRHKCIPALGGVTGSAVYLLSEMENFADILQLLHLGQCLQIGKQASHGFGEFDFQYGLLNTDNIN